MKHTLITAGLVALGIIIAPSAVAAPSFCGAHDAGDIYIHACASGGGGGGASEFALNDIIKSWNENPSHPNHGQYPHVER